MSQVSIFSTENSVVVDNKSQPAPWWATMLILLFLLKFPLKLMHLWPKLVKAFSALSLQEPLTWLLPGFAIIVIPFGFVVAVGYLLWLFGHEIIEANADFLTIRWALGGIKSPFKLKRRYKMHQVQNIHPAVLTKGEWSILKGGNIIFEINGKPHRMGLTLQKEDMHTIIDEIQPYLRQHSVSVIQ